jgi:(p)ppGpp synthase/HD superfamily hydrolase
MNDVRTRPSPPRLTPRLAAAFARALELHEGQLRKGTTIPYIAHLLAVTALVLEHGGDETEAMGALLHDAAEDQGGESVLAEFRDRFGEPVAAIVAACSDTFERPKPPWRVRKEAHVAHMATASPSVRLVVLADKVHNIEAILADHGVLGEALWSRFNASPEETLWYYRSMLAAIREAHERGVGDPRSVPLMDRLSVRVNVLETVVAS